MQRPPEPQSDPGAPAQRLEPTVRAGVCLLALFTILVAFTLCFVYRSFLHEWDRRWFGPHSGLCCSGYPEVGVAVTGLLLVFMLLPGIVLVVPLRPALAIVRCGAVWLGWILLIAAMLSGRTLYDLAGHLFPGSQGEDRLETRNEGCAGYRDALRSVTEAARSRRIPDPAAIATLRSCRDSFDHPPSWMALPMYLAVLKLGEDGLCPHADEWLACALRSGSPRLVQLGLLYLEPPREQTATQSVCRHAMHRPVTTLIMAAPPVGSRPARSRVARPAHPSARAVPVPRDLAPEGIAPGSGPRITEYDDSVVE